MRVRIYDTEGQLRYGRSEDDQRNRFVSEVYRNAKLRFLVDTREDSFRVLCYVRAVESEGQRSEQFYVDMVSDTPVELSEFKREAVGALRKVFHEIDLSNPTTNVFEYLDANIDVSGYLPEDDLHAVRSLADQGERLDFGAGDQRAALSVAKALGNVPAKVVIADAGRTEYYDDAEVVLDTGFDGEGIAASNQTTEKIQQYLERQSKGAAEEKVESIGKQAKELKEIKREEGLTASEVDKPLRNALKTQFPGIFRTERKETSSEKKTRKQTRTMSSETAKPETTTKPTSTDTEDSGEESFASRIPMKAVGSVFVVGLILLVVGGAAVTGVLPDDLPDLLPGSGDDGKENETSPLPEFSSNPFENLGSKDWNSKNISIGGELDKSTENTTVKGVLANSDGEGEDIVENDNDTEEEPFSLTYKIEDVRGKMGYEDHDLTLNLSIYENGNRTDSESDEFVWDVRVPPTLTMTNDTVSVPDNSSTVPLEVENAGNITGNWQVGLEVDGNGTDNETVERRGGDTDTVELTADTELTSDNNVTVTCTPDDDESKCGFDNESVSVE
jgi:hypothetical protein